MLKTCYAYYFFQLNQPIFYSTQTNHWSGRKLAHQILDLPLNRLSAQNYIVDDEIKINLIMTIRMFFKTNPLVEKYSTKMKKRRLKKLSFSQLKQILDYDKHTNNLVLFDRLSVCLLCLFACFCLQKRQLAYILLYLQVCRKHV